MTRGSARLSSAVLLAVLAAVSLLAEPAKPLADGTRAMVDELARRTAAIPPADLWINLNEQRAALLAQQVDAPRPVTADLRFRYLYASELLFAGRYADGIAQTDVLMNLVDRAGPEAGADAYLNVLMLRALTYLRWGEDQNCVNGVNADSCLLPISRGGVHTNREGATKAAETLARLLRVDPANLRARWLLNIAHMTLGTYPDGVPPALRIGPDVFTSPVPLPAFTNVATDVGLSIHGISGGAVMEDLDGDGFLDVMVSGAGFDSPLRVFRNTGAGRFEEATAQSGLDGLNGGLNLVHADFDNDGLPDVLVLRGAWMGVVGQFPVSLLKNLGGFRFADVTRAAGLDIDGPTQTAAWFDYDGDGWLDLIVGREAGPAPNERFATRLFHSNRDGTFSDVTKAVGLDVMGFVKAVVAGDYNNDGRPDLYVSQANAIDRLLHNDGPQPGGGWRFTDVTAKAGVPGMINSFPAAWFDYDNDGRLDLFVGSFLAQAEDVAADYLGLPTSARALQALSQQGRRHLQGRQRRPPAGSRRAGDGAELRRSRQRRMARSLHRDRQPAVLDAGPEPDVPQRRRQAVPGGHDRRQLRPSPEGARDRLGRRRQRRRPGRVRGDGWRLPVGPRLQRALPEPAVDGRGRKDRLGQPRARGHDRQPVRDRRPRHGPPADALGSAPRPPRRRHRRQLGSSRPSRLRRHRRRYGNHRRRRAVADRAVTRRGAAGRELHRHRPRRALPAEAGSTRGPCR